MKLIIATKNAGKIEGAERAFSKYFDEVTIEGVSVPSDVPDQPVNDEITLGAKNRVKNLKKYCKDKGISADLFLSIESGINNFFGEWVISNVAIVEDNDGFASIGVSPSFPVPERLVDNIIKSDLSLVMDDIFGVDRERHNGAGGIQLLTKNKVSRIDLTELAFTMAIIRYINKEWN